MATTYRWRPSSSIAPIGHACSFCWAFHTCCLPENLGCRPSFRCAEHDERRRRALLGRRRCTITAAVVGVVLNLTVWFGLYLLFRHVREVPFAGSTLDVPVHASVNLAALALTIAAVAVFRFNWLTWPTAAPTLRATRQLRGSQNLRGSPEQGSCASRGVKSPTCPSDGAPAENGSASQASA